MAALAGKKAVVTGGRQGIGRGIVDAFVHEGATVLTCGRGGRSDDLLDAVHWQQCDMADAADVKRLLCFARKRNTEQVASYGFRC